MSEFKENRDALNVTKCGKCLRDIVFKKTASGKFMPFDFKPTIVLIIDNEGKEIVMKGHVSHFVTCPYSDHFSNKNKSRGKY